MSDVTFGWRSFFMEFIVKKEDTFNLKDTLECGQVFRFREEGNGYIMFSGSHYAKSSEDTDNYYFETDDAEYFRKYFDLERDYKKIQDMYISDPFLKGPIEYGKGIHLLQQDKAEMIISFIISQNNNIPRIKGIIEKICLSLGEDKGFYYAFPGIDKLASAGEEFYKSTGAGYRAAYLDRVSNELLNTDVEKLDELETPELREKLLSLYGVGRKVADCILLFGFSRYDVFPVDTWIKKVFRNELGDIPADKMSTLLVKKYGLYSGFVQQWLFYNQRNL